jgi:uncharacterized protein
MCSLIVRLSLIALLSCCAGAACAADSLYRAQTIVTGQGEANRTIGFAACLEDVLIKVSGALKLAGDPRLDAYKSRAGDFVDHYDYHDQMSGTPKRDEQGTRDRPYDLIVDFDETKINEALTALALKPWLGRRPVLRVIVLMEQGSRRYLVSSEDRQSELQREALFAAAAKRGMVIVLPSPAAASALMTADGKLPNTWPSDGTATKPVGDVTLVGHLAWSDQDLGWATDWQLAVEGKLHRWQVRGVTFDEAFRRGIGGAAQILSGNGDPAS